MKIFLAALMVVAGLGRAQSSGQGEQKSPPDDHTGKSVTSPVLRRLEAVTWDPLQAQLIWVISVWDLESDMSKPAELERYTIHVNDGVMEKDGERRAFAIPKDDLNTLMDIISTYAMRSTVWWGHGATPGGPGAPGAPQDGGSGTKDKNKDDGGSDKPKLTQPGKVAGLQPHLSTDRARIAQ